MLPSQVSFAQNFDSPRTGPDQVPTVLVAVSGRIVVVQNEEFVGFESTEHTADHHDHDDRSTFLWSETGDAIPLEPDTVAGAQSGDRFDGTVAVPSTVVEAAGVEASEAETIGDRPRVEAIATEVADAGEPVEVVDGSPQPVAGARTSAQAHTLDVAVVTPAGLSATAYTQQQVDDLRRSTDYWVREARGQISSFATGQTQRYRTTLTCSADPFAFWEEAVRKFGYDPDSYFDTDGRHVALVLPQSCESTAGLGLGTVGSHVHQSGLVMMSTGFDLDTSTMTHELGHNLGLGHSNLDFCDSSSCQINEYADVWDVMGLGIQGWDTASHLNVEKLLALGFVGDGDVPVLQQPGGTSWSTRRVSITANDIDPANGRPMGFRVQDPNGGEYVLEYRDGEPGVFYDRTDTINLSSKQIQLGRGVRLLRDVGDEASAASAPRTSAGTYDPAAAQGEKVGNASGSVNVNVVSAADGVAQIDVTLISPRFLDVSPNTQFVREISWLADRGISTGWQENGGSVYRPVTPVARNAMAAFLYRLKGSPSYTPPAVSPFTDVRTTDQFYKEISWLKAQNISTGWDAGDGKFEFRPLQPVARDAMAAFLFRFAEVSSYTPRTQAFSDVPPNRQFYREISWLAERGISTGYVQGGGRVFDPAASVNRDAMAAFMFRFSNS